MTPTNDSQLSYLQDQIVARLKSTDSSTRYYRHRHYRYQSSAVVLAALITILSGLKLPALHFCTSAAMNAGLTDIVLVLGAVSTVLAAFGSFFSPQQSWYLNAETYCKLRALQAKIDMDALSSSFAERKDIAVAGFFAEYQAILAEYNQKWMDMRQKSK